MAHSLANMAHSLAHMPPPHTAVWQVPAFRDCSLAQVCELVPRIVRQYALSGQFIVRQGHPGLGLFMISRGVCEVGAILGRTGCHIREGCVPY
eukprot:5991957-Prymnesium_polylepis.1